MPEIHESTIEHPSEQDSSPETCHALRMDIRRQVEHRLVTSALPYINNVPHLGHIAGSHLPADLFARYSRLKGHDVLFIGGSDEHGTPSEIASRQLGVDIQTFCDTLHREHERIYQWFQISYDRYTRTSAPDHHRMTQEFFKLIYENGFISRETIQMYFDPQEQMFLADRYVEGTCPKCGYQSANGDQCESCSAFLTVDDLLAPRSKVSGATPEKRATEHLFLNLDALSGRLEEWINQNDHWRPQVRSLALGWIKEGLRKRSITRDLRFGVKVPLEGFEDKVFYVWFDAPIGYISGTVEADPAGWQRFWRDPDGKIYHFLGKDNIPFHTIFWPAMIMAEGQTNLPHQVAGMQYLNYEGGKFSKSQKRGVFCESLPESGISSDLLRAYLAAIIPESADSEFQWDDFMARVNGEVIGKFGNFVHRSLSFIWTKFNSSVARPDQLTPEDEALLALVSERIGEVSRCFEQLKLRQAYSEVMGIADLANKYFNDQKPWAVLKADPAAAERTLFVCARLTATLTRLMAPFTPAAAAEIWRQLGLSGRVDEANSWDQIGEDLPAGLALSAAPTIPFRKITPEILAEFKQRAMAMKDLADFFPGQASAGEASPSMS